MALGCVPLTVQKNNGANEPFNGGQLKPGSIGKQGNLLGHFQSFLRDRQWQRLAARPTCCMFEAWVQTV
jgi:hypothetical protein